MVWIFGYGSLIWKVDFPFKRKLIGYVEGFTRRFWWWSEDHRGIPGAPGRVVNLNIAENATDRVWGVAYEVDDQLWRDQIQAQLDHREKGGYSRHIVIFHPLEENPKEVTIYIGDSNHRQFAGPASVEDMAMTIWQSEGPSGRNKDYLYNLADALRTIDPHDAHVFDLEKAVRNLDTTHTLQTAQ